jgi:hypothetical protein
MQPSTAASHKRDQIGDGTTGAEVTRAFEADRLVRPLDAVSSSGAFLPDSGRRSVVGGRSICSVPDLPWAGGTTPKEAAMGLVRGSGIGGAIPTVGRTDSPITTGGVPPPIGGTALAVVGASVAVVGAALAEVRLNGPAPVSRSFSMAVCITALVV